MYETKRVNSTSRLILTRGFLVFKYHGCSLLTPSATILQESFLTTCRVSFASLLSEIIRKIPVKRIMKNTTSETFFCVLTLTSALLFNRMQPENKQSCKVLNDSRIRA